MNKKYELTNETIEYLGHTLHRIVALKDFSDVKAGDKGGYIESEDNLDQTGYAWVYDDAKVCMRAKVIGNAAVKKTAAVFGDAILTQNAKVSGNACIYGTTHICGRARVGGDSTVYDSANIRDKAKVYNASIGGQAVIAGNAAITSANDLMAVGPFVRSRYISFYKTNDGGIGVNYKEFKGTLSEFMGFIMDLVEHAPHKSEVFTTAAELAKLKLGE